MTGAANKRAAPPSLNRQGRGTWHMQRQHHPLDLEHRLTTVEVRQEVMQRDQDHHADRLEELERKQITPRDWLLIAGGFATVLGALAGKVEWSTVIELLAKGG